MHDQQPTIKSSEPTHPPPQVDNAADPTLIKRKKRRSVAPLPQYAQRMHPDPPQLIDAIKWDTLHVSDVSPLFELKDRVVCPECKHSYKIYCPECCVTFDHVPPRIRLPLKLDVYRHPKEKEGKTTSVHAKLIAPDDTELYVEDFTKGDEAMDKVLDRYPDPSRVLLLFPSADSVTLDQLPRESFDKLIVIDGTWRQARAMCWSLLPHGFKPVRIGTCAKTLFWRFQQYGDHCLATIEAIYWFYREYDLAYGHARSVLQEAVLSRANDEQGRSEQEVDSSSSSLSTTTTTATTTALATTTTTPPPPVSAVASTSLVTSSEYNHELDELLYYFKYQYLLIQKLYKEDEVKKNKSFCNRKRDHESYIHYE